MDVSIGESEDNASQPDQTKGVRLRNFLSVTLLFVALVAFYVLLPPIAAPTLSNAFRILIILTAGWLPWLIYKAFIQIRLSNIFIEYKRNLRRLGFLETAQEYIDKFNEVYGASQAGAIGSSFLKSPIYIATLLSIIGWVLVFFPLSDSPGELIPNPTPVAYGFLGAYIFGMGSLVRQFMADDIQLRYYASLTHRYLTVFVLSWLITLLLPADPAGELTQPQNFLIAAFVIGLFPTSGLRVAARVGARVLNIRLEGFEENQPLTQLDGLNAYHEDRLLLEGIESVQNMSCANIVDLMLKTRYPVEQIVDWINQALLMLHARERYPEFQKSGIRTATDFLDTYFKKGLSHNKRLQWHKDLAQLLDSNAANNPAEASLTLTFIDAIAQAIQADPNLLHVRNWHEHEYEILPEEVERDRTIADLKLMQGFHQEAIEIYKRVLKRFPNYHTARLYRGIAYFAMGKYVEAVEDYTSAIELGGANWQGVHHAYLQRGRALRQMGDYAAALDDFEHALLIDPQLAEAHLELAYLLMTFLSEYDEALPHLQFAVDHNFRKADSLANLGLARHELWKQTGSPVETLVEELSQAKADLEHALSLNPNLIAAYLNLANVLEDLGLQREAHHTLTQALEKLKNIDDPANAYRTYLHRGNLSLSLGEFQSAADDYRAATRLAPDNAAAYYNLGIALERLGEAQGARMAYEKAVDLMPGHAPAQQSLADTLLALGRQAAADGQADQAEEFYKQAESHYAEALRLARETDDQLAQAQVHLNLGRLYRYAKHRQDDAQRELEIAARMAGDLEDDVMYTRATYQLGSLAKEQRDYEKAQRLLSAAAELFDVIGACFASVQAYAKLGQVLESLRQYPQARHAYETARQKFDHCYDHNNPEHGGLMKKIVAAIKRLDRRLQENGGTPAPAE